MMRNKILYIVVHIFLFILLLELSISNNRVDTLLFYLFSIFVLYFSRFNKLIYVICIFLASYSLTYASFQITMTHVKNGPGLVKGCSVDGVNKSTKEKRAYSYENSCVFLSDMYSGWRAKYYWAW